MNEEMRLGDRTLFLRTPHFCGPDVTQLQNALSAMGFYCGKIDGEFDAHTEDAVRLFQINLDLFADGIVGAQTFEAIRNLRISWEGKETLRFSERSGYARASEVLERRCVCLFGVDGFTREVAKRISNLALATNPASKITSADSLLVAPDRDMLLVHIALPTGVPGAGVVSTTLSAPTAGASDTFPMPAGSNPAVPVVPYGDGNALDDRLSLALRQAAEHVPPRLTILLPGRGWQDAGENRSAQHFAITVLDALCTALDDSM